MAEFPRAEYRMEYLCTYFIMRDGLSKYPRRGADLGTITCQPKYQYDNTFSGTQRDPGI